MLYGHREPLRREHAPAPRCTAPRASWLPRPVPTVAMNHSPLKTALAYECFQDQDNSTLALPSDQKMKTGTSGRQRVQEQVMMTVKRQKSKSSQSSTLSHSNRGKGARRPRDVLLSAGDHSPALRSLPQGGLARLLLACCWSSNAPWVRLGSSLGDTVGSESTLWVRRARCGSRWIAHVGGALLGVLFERDLNPEGSLFPVLLWGYQTRIILKCLSRSPRPSVLTLPFPGFAITGTFSLQLPPRRRGTTFPGGGGVCGGKKRVTELL